MKYPRALCAAIILIMPLIALSQGAIVPPSGDTTGKTDGAAINAALSANLSATLACNSHYYTNVSIQVPQGASFVGCGINSIITGVGSIAGGIVELGRCNGNDAAELVGNFQIAGGTATNAVLAGGSQNIGPCIAVHLSNIWVSGGTYTDVFSFNTFFNDQADNLAANGTMSVSASCFHFDGGVNADTFNTLLADCGAPYGFYMENDNGTGGGSTGNTFNALTAEGGCPGAGSGATCAGLYVGSGFGAAVFNGLYTENVLHPIVLGNAAANKACTALTFNSPVITGPSAIAKQVALVDLDDCTGVTFISPTFTIYGIFNSAPLSFSGGCATEPVGVAIPNPSGIIKAITLEYPGAGCTSAPTVGVGGAGAGAHVTAIESGGVVTSLTLNAGGSGYTLHGIVPLVYNVALKATIVNPVCFDGAQGYVSACWPWMVRASGAVGGVQFEGDTLNVPGTESFSADLKYTGIGNQHYATYMDASGTSHLVSVVPQPYP